MLRVDFSDIEVCMLTHNEESVLPTTLAALSTKFSRFSFVDQGSTDRTRQIIGEVLGTRAKVVVETPDYIREIGFAAARNRLSAMAVRPWLLHVDADEFAILPSDAQDIRSVDASEKSDSCCVTRRNLIRPQNLSLPLAADTIASLPAYSTESHVRFYRNHADIRWRSFIHEELWQGNEKLPQTPFRTNLVLEHLSQFKDGDIGEKKEDYYAWMLLEGLKKAGIEDRLSDYSLHALQERDAYFRERAKNFEGLVAKLD